MLGVEAANVGPEVGLASADVGHVQVPLIVDEVVHVEPQQQDAKAPEERAQPHILDHDALARVEAKQRVHARTAGRNGGREEEKVSRCRAVGSVPHGSFALTLA